MDHLWQGPPLPGGLDEHCPLDRTQVVARVQCGNQPRPALVLRDCWHGFYSKLKRNDGQGSCCNMMDCRPTQSRMVGDHYEVKVDGEWTSVPNDKINNVVAPDGGAHVCAPTQFGPNKGVIFCVILPPEG
jgi:hypothetical protein